MSVQVKPNTNIVWASGPFGRFVPVTEAHQLNGWGAEIPEFDEFNGMINQLSAFDQHINQFGVAVWDYLTQYPVNGYVSSPVDGNLYRAVTTNNNTPPVDVVGGAVSVFWVRVSFTTAEIITDVTPLIAAAKAEAIETATAQAVLLAAPPGQSAYFAMATAPAGWLKENGAAVSRVAYAALFAAIGTTYGAGDGGATFNLPDSRAQFKRALDDGKGLNPARVIGTLEYSQNLSHTHTASSAAAGAHTHTASSATAGAHTHTVSYGDVTPDGSDLGTVGEPRNPLNAGDGGTALTTLTSSDGSHTHGITVDAVGDHTHAITVNADGGIEARPINIAYLSCIKY
jgi:microcystin-dependent protein